MFAVDGFRASASWWHSDHLQGGCVLLYKGPLMDRANFTPIGSNIGETVSKRTDAPFVGNTQFSTSQNSVGYLSFEAEPCRERANRPG